MQQNNKVEFSTKQQYKRTVFLGIAFMVLFTSYNSLQNMISKLYQQHHHKNLGQTAIIFVYVSFAICTFFTSYFIKKFGYKTVMLGSSIGYTIFNITALFVIAQYVSDQSTIWIIVICGSILCGASASCIWVAQGAYISRIASNQNKKGLFAIFWGLMMSSQIFGSLLSIFFLSNTNNFVYIAFLCSLGVLSVVIFMFLPQVTKCLDVQKRHESIKIEVKKIFWLTFNPKYTELYLYYIAPGITLAFYSSFLYKVVQKCVKHIPGEDFILYNKRVNQSTGYVFLVMGFSKLFMGLLMGKYSHKYSYYSHALLDTGLVISAAMTSLLTFYYQDYYLCYLCAFLWGCSDNHLQTNTNALIAQLFPNRIEGYSAYRIYFSLGVIATIGLTIILSRYPGYVFLIIVLIIHLLTTSIALRSNFLKNSEFQDYSSQLISPKKQQ